MDKPITPGISFSDVSDHLPIFQVTTLTANNDEQQCIKNPQSFNHQNVTNVNFTDLIQELCFVTWSKVDACNDVDVSYSNFLETLITICSKHTFKPAPNNNKRKKFNIRKPWITKGILKSINKKTEVIL